VGAKRPYIVWRPAWRVRPAANDSLRFSDNERLPHFAYARLLVGVKKPYSVWQASHLLILHQGLQSIKNIEIEIVGRIKAARV